MNKCAQELCSFHVKTIKRMGNHLKYYHSHDEILQFHALNEMNAELMNDSLWCIDCDDRTCSED